MIRRKIKNIVEEEKKKILADLSIDPVGCLKSLLEKVDIDFSLVGDDFHIKTLSEDILIISVTFIKS